MLGLQKYESHGGHCSGNGRGSDRPQAPPFDICQHVFPSRGLNLFFLLCRENKHAIESIWSRILSTRSMSWAKFGSDCKATNGNKPLRTGSGRIAQSCKLDWPVQATSPIPEPPRPRCCEHEAGSLRACFIRSKSKQASTDSRQPFGCTQTRVCVITEAPMSFGSAQACGYCPRSRPIRCSSTVHIQDSFQHRLKRIGALVAHVHATSGAWRPLSSMRRAAPQFGNTASSLMQKGPCWPHGTPLCGMV